MPASSPVAAAAAAVSGCVTSVPSTISGSSPRRRVEPERLDHRVVVAAGAEVAEGPARLRRIGRAHAGQVQVEPVLAVQRHLGAVEQLRRRPLHLRQLRALLAGVEPGAGRLEPRPLQRARALSRSTVGAARASSQSQASPTGASPAPTSQVPSPCAVTAIAAVRRARSSTFSPRPRSACDAVGPGPRRAAGPPSRPRRSRSGSAPPPRRSGARRDRRPPP